MNNELVKVDFHGDTLECVEQDGKVWVSLRRVCESLGIDLKSQSRRVKNKPWACMVMMTIHDTSGREQETSMLDLDSLPMWLATIETNRVAEAVRPKLIEYQKECARVLRDHFAKPQTGLMTFDATRELCEQFMRPVIAVLEEHGKQIMQLCEILQHPNRNAHPASLGPKWTVEQRLYEMKWDGTTQKQRARIRKLANEMLDSVHGEEPEYKFGRYFYFRNQLDTLDRAIAVVKRESERVNDDGMFSGI